MNVWSELLGHRCILKDFVYSTCLFEVKIVEVSPRGRVKVRYDSGVESWEEEDKYFLVEDLGVWQREEK